MTERDGGIRFDRVSEPAPQRTADSGQSTTRPDGPQPASTGTVTYLQRSAGNRAVLAMLDAGRPRTAPGPGPVAVQRFGSAEHAQIGNAATFGERTTIRYGEDDNEVLTFGEVSALVGDYFDSVQDMHGLSLLPEGRLEIAYVRWRALARAGEPRPDVPDELVRRVDHRFVRLVGDNASHFAADGGAATTYEDGHVTALRLAFWAGLFGSEDRFAEAMTVEAGCQHYLIDLFAGGHVRTPRAQIQRWYAKNFPESADRIHTYLIDRLTEHVLAAGVNPAVAPYAQPLYRRGVRGELLARLGPAFRRFSLGDIVGMALHDHDNAQGVRVTSDRDAEGNLAPFTWRAFGDETLKIGPDQAPTLERAIGAARASVAELALLRQAGANQWATGGLGPSPNAIPAMADAAIAAIRPFAALSRVPRAVSGNVPVQAGPASDESVLVWQWGSFTRESRAAVDSAVRNGLADQLRGFAEGSENAAALTALADEIAQRGIDWLADAVARQPSPGPADPSEPPRPPNVP